MLAARRMMIDRARRQFLTGISFSQGQSGDFRIWTWELGGATSQALVNTTGGGGVFELAKSGSTYTGKLAGTTIVSWTDTGGIATWGHVVGALLGPLGSSTVDDFIAGAFTDDFNRVNGPVGNGWSVSGPGTGTAGPQIASNAVVNNTTAGANERTSMFRTVSATPPSVKFTLSAAPNPSGGYCHVFCGANLPY